MYRLMRTLLFVALVTASIITPGCGGSSNNKTDATGSGSGSGSNSCTGGSACGQPCDEGNNLGVGKFCSKGSGQCGKNTSSFIFCTIDFDSTAPDAFCTGPCGSDADCGDDAFCDNDGSGTSNGCVPANCGGTPMGSGSGSA
jgi:hypothetical protein